MTSLDRETQYVYDAADRLIETIHPDGSREQQAYDARGRRIRQTDANGYSTHYEYDGVGNLVAVEDALGQRTEYGYDEQSNKLRQTDAEGRSTVWAYDDLGRVSSRTLPLGQSESFQYDAVGNRTQRVDFNGTLSTVAYDSSDRPTQHSYADGTVVSTSYTPSGQIDTVVDDRGLSTYSYDSRDRLISLTQPDGRSIDYAYDPVGNRIQLSAPSGDVRTSYDALHRIDSVSDALTGTTYDPVGNPTERRYSNGGIERTSYDSLNRPILIEHLDAQGQLIQRQAYTLGLAGHRTSITDLDGRRVEYGYDSLYRLTRERVTDTTRGNTETLWTYDRVGNRLTQTECTPRCGQGGVEVLTSYSYDANDRLLSENRNGQVTSYSYDANGNTTQKATPEGITTTIYNSQDRLIQASTPTDSLSFSYDHNGIRQSKTVNGIRTEYLVDPNQAYAQVIAEYDDLGSLLVDYVFGQDLIRQDRGGTQSFYLYDALGSARGLADNAADLSDSYIYEAFGTLEQVTGSTQNSYLFAGEQFDQDLGLYYNRARYMDQATGRFTSMDAFQGIQGRPITLNKYAYANSDSVNWIDPTGNVGLGMFSLHSLGNFLVRGGALALGFYSKKRSHIADVLFQARSLTVVRNSIALGVLEAKHKGFGRKLKNIDRLGVYDDAKSDLDYIGSGLAALGVTVNSTSVTIDYKQGSKRVRRSASIRSFATSKEVNATLQIDNVGKRANVYKIRYLDEL